MILSELIAKIPEAHVVTGDPDVDVSSVEIDSRAVVPGSVFCCVPGTALDGHAFIAQAIESGAAAIVTERDAAPDLGRAVEVRVPAGTMRRVCARLSAEIVGNPASRLITIGITGTNGKTTVAYIVSQILEAAGFDATVIGTLTGARTTPAAPELHRLLALKVRQAEAAGRPGAVAMEVSSHALDQERVSGILFDVGVFTNLSPEHLDYHKTMDEYFAAKAKLFEEDASRAAVIWTGTPAGAELADRRHDARRVDLSLATEISMSSTGSAFTWRSRRVDLALIGSINVINALISLETALALEVDADLAAGALSAIAPVPGRMDLIGTSKSGATVIVDYAHTPEALDRLLEEARRLAGPSKSVIVVFGCGGDRDRGKRPVMGEVASRSADVVIVTTDNPRREEASDIVAEIMAGVVGSAMVIDIPERRRAIEEAIGQAHQRDVVVIAGKGHETTQIIGDVVTSFDDREVAREVMGLVD
jgi:UDP-N-acetylmuramoyl-L-alanyl-D-glutamate--2,6-diaminopimelate ligase